MATFNGNFFFADTIVGTNSADSIFGFGGDDQLLGNNGNDIIKGGSGKDLIKGGNNNDQLFGEDDNDTIFGDAGNDQLFGGNGIDILNGGANDDQLFGGTLGDTLNGDTGNDLFRDTEGNNIFNGGTGTDTADYSQYNGGITLRLGEGAANATASRTGAIFEVGAGTRHFADGSDTLNSIENVNGGLQADTITGNSLANVIRGNGGNDVLSGGGGFDTLFGGTNSDMFVFNQVDISSAITLPNGTRFVDRISDFSSFEQDFIDLRNIDANTDVTGNSAFRIVNQFSGTGGELLLRQDDATHFRLVGDTDGDGFGDMLIDVATNGAHTLAQIQADILL